MSQEIHLPSREEILEALRPHRTALILAGLIQGLLGVAAVAAPHIATEVGTALFGFVLLLAGAPALAEDPRFLTNSLRVQHRPDCVAAVTELTRHHTSDHWIEGLSAQGVPCGPVNTIDKVFENPQVQAREMRIELEHSATGKPEPYIASPIKLSETPVSYRRAAPTLGEHTEDVMGEMLGLDAAAVAKLRDDGVL